MNLGDAPPALAAATRRYLTALADYREAAAANADHERTTALAARLEDAGRALRDAIPDDCFGLFSVGPHRVGRVPFSRYGVRKVVQPFGRKGPFLD